MKNYCFSSLHKIYHTYTQPDIFIMKIQLYLCCTCIVLIMCLYCTCIVLALYLYCAYTVLALYLYCTCFVLVLYLYCTWIVLALYLYCTCIVLVLYLYCIFITCFCFLRACIIMYKNQVLYYIAYENKLLANIVTMHSLCTMPISRYTCTSSH